MIVEKAMAPHSSTFAWKILWTEESGRLQSMGSLRVGHDWATSLSLFTFMHRRRKWQPTPVFLPGESQGRGSLVGCCLWGCYDIEHLFMYLFSSVHLLSRVQLFAIPWTEACQASLSITNPQSSHKLMSIESVIPSNRLLCHPLLLPSIFPSIRVFWNESALYIRWPKYWSFSFNISPYNEHSWLISFRMDWLDLLAVQGTLKSLLQQHSL